LRENVAGIISNVKLILPNINVRIDQTLLKYDKSWKDYERFVNESDPYNFRSLVVPSVMVPFVASIAKTPVAGVAGFPHGYVPVESKLREIDAIANGGGREVDVVINVINVKSGKFDALRDELQKVVRHAHELGLGIKIIVETSALSDDELQKVSVAVAESGADFIKTNTGYGTRGASLRDVVLIRRFIGDRIKVKASGGIRNAVDAATFIIVGADVIGTSSGVRIMEDARRVLKLL